MTPEYCQYPSFFLFSDKPEVKIVVTYPEGLTREGDNLDLTCIAEGKPQ